MKMKQKRKLLKDLKENLTDFRTDKRKIIYPLEQIIFMSLTALMDNRQTYNNIHLFIKYNKDNNLYKKLFKVSKINAPSKSTLHRILINIDHNELENIYRTFFQNKLKELNITTKSIAIDGKFLNGSDINGQYTTEGHKSVLNIFDKDTKINLAHKFINDGYSKTKKELSEIPSFKNWLQDNEKVNDNSQLFTFDSLLTQYEILNKIDKDNNKFIAKVKNNQLKLKKQIIETIENTVSPTDTYIEQDTTVERCNYVYKKIEIYNSKSSNIILYNNNFNNIQTIIKVTKYITNKKTNKSKTIITYNIANYIDTAINFLQNIQNHWSVEKFHYHKDMLMGEDSHIAYINPFSITILRSFAINLFQLYKNKNTKESMANIKNICSFDKEFIFNLFE